MATLEGPAENGTHGGAAAGGGNTSDAASAAANKEGAGDRHGAMTKDRERVAGGRENPAGDPYGVGGEGEGREVYGLAGEPSGVGGEPRRP